MDEGTPPINRVVVSFGRTGDVYVFRTIGDAEKFMEPADVEDGEYLHTYLLDGRPITANVTGEKVSLTIREEKDEQALWSLLAAAMPPATQIESSDNVLHAVEELWKRQWQSRWPRFPGRGHKAPPPL